MKPAISVIIPVYNTESYLERCLKSILSQSFTDIELLLVDDGSTDRSGAICDEYAVRDNRIKVLHQENGGVSSARNLGLDQATGEYVIFADADDYWVTDKALERLYGIAKNNGLDMLRGEYLAVDGSNRPLYRVRVSNRSKPYTDRIIGSYEFLEYAIHGEFFLWLILFKRSAIGTLRFETGRIFLEDMEFLSRLLVNEYRCMYLSDEQFYAYTVHAESASNRFAPRRIGDMLAIGSRIGSLSETVEEPRLKRFLAGKSLFLFYLSLSYLSLDEYYVHRKRILKEYDMEERRRETAKRLSGNTTFAWAPICLLPATWGIRILQSRLRLARLRHWLLKRAKRMIRFPQRTIQGPRP